MNESGQPAVFLDRDGVLNRVFVHDGIPHPPQCIEQFELLPGAADAVSRLHGAGFAVVVVTNQPDVARGKQTRAAVEAMHARLYAELPLLDVRTCFHDDGDNCRCRKPKPGMIVDSARRWRLDLEQSFLVGDRWRDVLAGQAAGCRSILVETSYTERGRCRPDHIVGDLAAAAARIMTQLREAKAHEAVC